MAVEAMAVEDMEDMEGMAVEAVTEVGMEAMAAGMEATEDGMDVVDGVDAVTGMVEEAGVAVIMDTDGRDIMDIGTTEIIGRVIMIIMAELHMTIIPTIPATIILIHIPPTMFIPLILIMAPIIKMIILFLQIKIMREGNIIIREDNIIMGGTAYFITTNL